LIVQQIDHEACDARAILHRRVDPLGERVPATRSAARAPTVMGAMFGHYEKGLSR
jgi:hypothetical protein